MISLFGIDISFLNLLVSFIRTFKNFNTKIKASDVVDYLGKKVWILMPTLVKYDDGVKLYRTEDRLSLLADPTTIKAALRSTATFITHSHSDHSITFPNAGSKVYATKISQDLFSALMNKKPKNSLALNFHENKIINDVEVKFIPAGHLLGAAQILFYFEDKTVLYTGDLCTEKMLTVPAAEIPDEDIDIVITEATYGDPNLFFEPREKTKISLFKWIASSLQNKVVPVINIGHLGPAQEIIAFLNQMLSADIYCNNRTSAFNQIYSKNGVKLSYRNFENKEIEEFNPGNSIVLLPRGRKKLPKFLSDYKTERSMITGQSVRFGYSSFDNAFPFSMHSNAAEIINHLKKLNPKQAFTMYGFESELASHIRRKLKIPARPLKLADKKMSLDEFL